MADNGDDWLAGLAAMVPMAGGAVQWITNHAQDAVNDPLKTGLEAVGYGAASTFTNALGEFGKIAGPVFNEASTLDPSQIITKPVMGALHDIGIGQQGDQWDTGLIGMAGDTFDKISRLATFVSLVGAGGDKTMPDGSSYNARAWSMAFSGQNPVRFGESMLGDASVVTDPNGLSKLRNDINSTWYGSGVSGALDMLQMAALDPTKGLGRVAEAGRMAKYVDGRQMGDRLATVANTTLDAPYKAAADQANDLRLQANGEEDATKAQQLRDQADQIEANVTPATLPSGIGAKVSNMVHAATPGLNLDDATVAGTQLASKGIFDNVTNTQQILNRLTPTLGMGGIAPRAALPVVAEMYADAAKATTDIALQRQIKLNVDYAMTGSQQAMTWLAKNYPTIAAKGARTNGAPAEFALLEDAMQGYHDAYNVAPAYGRTMGPSGPTPGATFDVGDYVNRFFNDPAKQAEQKAYGDAINQLNQFRDTLWHGGPNGEPIDMGTSGHMTPGGMVNNGIQVAPRALESLKYQLMQKVGDEYLYKTGPSGMTIRVLNSLATDSSPNGYVNLLDPIQGGQQLANHMKQYQGSVDGLDGNVIRQTVNSFQKLDVAGRKQLVANVGNAMMSGIGAKYGISGDDLAQLVQQHADAIATGRQFASSQAMQAAANGNQLTSLGDLTGTPTFMRTAYLQNHLDTTAPLLDFKSADRAVRLRQQGYAKDFGESLKQTGASLGALGLKGLASYHSMWKVAMLGRLGLLGRAQLDTGIRGVMVHGANQIAQEAFKGVGNYLNDHTALPLGDQNTMAISFMARQAADRMGDVATTLQQESDESAAQIAARQAQVERANELADTFHSRQRENGRFTPTTKLYQAKEQEARDLSARLSGDQTTVGNNDVTIRDTRNPAVPPKVVGQASDFQAKPLGLDAMNSARDVLEPIRQQNIEKLRDAQAAYLTPQPLTKQLTSTPKTFSSNGVMFTGAPVMTDLEAATLRHDVRDSNNVLSDLMIGSLDNGLYKQRVDLRNWSNNVLPKDVQWPEKYAMAANDFHGSYTAHRMLQERMDDVSSAPEAYLRSFLDDKAVQNEFRTVTGGGDSLEFQRWLSDIATSVKSMAPNETFRQALLSGKELTPQDVAELAPNVEDRFPTYGPTFYHDAEPNVIQNAVEQSFKYLLDLPDVYLARVPYYVPLYQKNIEAMLPAYAEEARNAGTLIEREDGGYELSPDDAMDLHARARQRALNDVHRDMYDVSKAVGVTGAMRYIAPFFNPWLQAQQSWARLIYDNPAIWGKMLRYSQTPDMFHLTTNAAGQPVNPWDGTPGMDKKINIPLFGLAGLRSAGLTVGSFNVIIQGNTPFSPGFGPLVQVPAQVLVARALPNVMQGKLYNWFLEHPQNPVNEILFPRPGDIPKSDAKSLFADVAPMPTWVKQASDAILGSNGFGNTYSEAFGSRYNEGIVEYRQDHNGKDPSTKADWDTIYNNADKAARAAAMVRMAESFGLGISGNAEAIGQYYKDKMQALNAATTQLHAMGTSPTQVFARNYPLAANLNWSFSQNQGNLEATVNSTSDYLKYRSLMDAHPDVMWWVAGPDNLVNSLDPNSTFSGSAYNTQMNEGLRTQMSAQDIMKADQVAMGAGRWNNFKQALRLYMDQNNIPSLHDASAGNLAGLQQQYEETLRQQFPEWAAHVDATNIGGGRDQEINQMKDIINNPPSSDFLQRPDIKATQQYLMARDALIHQAQQDGITNWQTAASMEPYRAALYAYGYQMATSDLVFHQAWTKLFEGEFYKDILAAKNAAMTPQENSTTLGQAPVNSGQ